MNARWEGPPSPVFSAMFRALSRTGSIGAPEKSITGRGMELLTLTCVIAGVPVHDSGDHRHSTAITSALRDDALVLDA